LIESQQTTVFQVKKPRARHGMSIGNPRKKSRTALPLAFRNFSSPNCTDTVPVPLNAEHYQLLSDAYTHAASLDDLFRQYRLANLTDAPLREKLPILRSIAEKDAGNFFWLEDVEQFEKVRQEELKNEITTAAKNQAQLGAVYEDIKAQPWRVPPQNLITQIVLPVLSSRAAKLQEYCNNRPFL
jgi:hypothetical protein